jgi:hypothetical protein
VPGPRARPATACARRARPLRPELNRAHRLRESFLLQEGRVLGRVLGFAVGYNQTHSYLNGGLRMESLMTFLWPGTSEGGWLGWP